MKRRTFLKSAAVVPGLSWAESLSAAAKLPLQPAAGQRYAPERIANDYSLLLPGEREALQTLPAGAAAMAPGEERAGWRALAQLAGDITVLERHVTHQGVLVYVGPQGEIARIPKHIGDLAQIRPRPLAGGRARITRPARYQPGPDAAAAYVLNSREDPCYENVAGLAAEFTGWALAANEEAGPERSLFLEPDGRSRQLAPGEQIAWSPDTQGRAFDPARLLPSEYLYQYVPGYSKRTLLGGYLAAPSIGVWNPRFQLGYEVTMVLPPGPKSQPMARVRAMLPAAAAGLIPPGDSGYEAAGSQGRWRDRYWQATASEFFSAVLATWQHWQEFFAQAMQADIPDPWLAEAARAGIVLSRCSYRGLEPTYQVGEGAYTKIPERSHALFPVAHYEFIWAQQIWGLSRQAAPYFQHYLDRYILPSGDFLYNTQDQVEAPLNAGVFLANSARAFAYDRDRAALQQRLPVLRRMIGLVRDRYAYSKRQFPPTDGRHGLIWGSPEADMGDPHHNTPSSHPYYFENATWIWRGLHEHARCLHLAGAGYAAEAGETERLAAALRADVTASLRRTLAACSPAMRAAKITPFSPDDTSRDPRHLTSYENHRYMMDWWTCEWGDAALDEGHFRHRALAGQQMLGMNTDGEYPRTSNFMEHGTLAGRIRQRDYRPFLMALYGNLCFAMDAGSRYAPEDALLPGNFPGEGSPYAWSAVINSTLQPAMGLRWLLCWEDWNEDVAHLQKAAPKHWFARGERIAVERCPTRFGELSWQTTAQNDRQWQVEITLPPNFAATLMIHIHPPGGEGLRQTSAGTIVEQAVRLAPADLAGRTHRRFTAQS